MNVICNWIQNNLEHRNLSAGLWYQPFASLEQDHLETVQYLMFLYRSSICLLPCQEVEIGSGNYRNKNLGQFIKHKTEVYKANPVPFFMDQVISKPLKSMFLKVKTMFQ